MRHMSLERIASRVATVMLLCVVMYGCERDPAPPQGTKEAFVPRTQDPEYKKALDDVQTRRAKVATERHKMVRAAEVLIARARAALPAGATDEQVKNELDANPEKYPSWKSVSQALREVTAQANRELDDARRLVMARIQKEQSELSKRGGNK